MLPRLDPGTVERLRALGWMEGDTLGPPAEAVLRIVGNGPDPDGALWRLLELVEADPGLDLLADSTRARRLAHLAGASRALTRQLAAHPAWLTGPGPGELVGQARRELADVAGADLAGDIDVDEGGRRLSDLADRLVGEALDQALAEPGDLRMCVVAMGKWGGRELNYWSDIDLLFAYDNGDSRHANRVAAAVMRRLGGPGPDGVVFNVDADLRPEGTAGPLARSLDAYRSYYERWSEPWELQALLKARPAAGDAGVGERFMDLVQAVLWPETIDPEAIRSLRALKARAEERAEPDDIKRGPGGIRDVEFAVQLLQLVHGRFDPDLRATATTEVLETLAAGGYVPADDARALAHSYRWLRDVEHRIQLWDLRQTHTVPSHPDERARLARSMGYRDGAEGTALARFDHHLVTHRSAVRQIHEDLYFRPLLEAFAASSTAGLTREGAEARLAALGYRDVAGAARALEELTAGLSRRSRLMQQMLPLILDWLADSPDPDLGLAQLRSLMVDAPDNASLISTLHDRPVAGRRLALLLGSSRLLGDYIDRIPEFIPRLVDEDTITKLTAQPELADQLRRRVETRPRPDDKVATLRRFARRRLLRVAARDLLGMAGARQAMADLSDGADASVQVAVELAGPAEGFAVMAMGRWGGSELGYGSDLDVIYAYRSPHNADSARALAVELGEVLARPGPHGAAWRLDADLRPEGRSGPLARSFEAYSNYYRRWAETWEIQSLVKARPAAGDPALGADFTAMIEPYLWRSDPTRDRDIRLMKARVEKERMPAGEDPDFHLKLGPGGLTDVEFLTQLLQLRHGLEHPELRVTGTLDALDRLGAIGALTEGELGALVEAYLFCTHVRNRLYLQVGRPTDALPRAQTEETRLAASLGYDRRSDLREEYRRVTRRARRVFEDRFYREQ